jgi:DNA-binding response OmpR family regulator
VYGIVQQSGGTIAVRSQDPRGSIFTVQIPLAENPTSRVSAATLLSPATAGTEAVLLVEDEEAVRRSLAAGLGAFGYEVLPAASPADAIAIASSRTRRIDALVTDIGMPFMNGTTLDARIRALRPNIRTLFISGYPPGQASLGEHVAKPFHCRELAARLRKVLDSKQEKDDASVQS